MIHQVGEGLDNTQWPQSSVVFLDELCLRLLTLKPHTYDKGSSLAGLSSGSF